MELEFAIDPLFKKASADFDEGGAKGLLLNHLAIDATGRIVFDSSDDAHEVDQEDQNTEEMETGECAHGGIQTQYIYQHSATQEADMDGLAYKFFPDLGFLDGLDICPSLKTFELGEADGSLDLPFLKAHNDWNHQGTQGGIGTGMVDGDEDLGGAFEYDDNIGEFDLPADVRFGEGGEAWAKEAALDRPMGLHILHTVEGEEGAEGIDSEDVLDCNDRYGISMRLGDSNEQQNILDYFDKALQKNWAGPEHWKIRRVKDASKSANAGPTKRKERESFEIDFVSPMSQALADALYTPVTSNSAISLPRTQWRSKTRNLLPDDKHFSSRQLLRLFLKPKAILSRRQGGRKLHTIAQPPYGEIDEQYWAQQEGAIAHIEGDDDAVGNYDANFFLDDGFGGIPDVDEDDEFADARDHFSPQAENGIPPGEDGLISDGPFGAQLVTQSRRLRPEYVQYARVATKVDVRRLKEEIWRGLAIEEVSEITHFVCSIPPTNISRTLKMCLHMEKPPSQWPTTPTSLQKLSTASRQCIPNKRWLTYLRRIVSSVSCI
jgi:condensin complex subunit 2